MSTWAELPAFADGGLFYQKCHQVYNRAERAYPSSELILRPFWLTELNKVQVVILGQDPYPTPGVADGLAFSTATGKAPGSLRNILTELRDDLGIEKTNPSLEGWAKQGVFLFNTSLTLNPETKQGDQEIWHDFTMQVLNAIEPGTVFLLMGKKAQAYGARIQRIGQMKTKAIAHPSPMNNPRGGFLGTKPFSFINEYVQIDWSL